jgi:predicted GTPase
MAEAGKVRRVVIMGAAGRDFHNFNMVYRDNPGYEVVAFTATQIPGIVGRRYPPALAGAGYPDGLPIFDEGELDRLCCDEAIDEVAFSYSDVTHETVMHAASRVLAAGADFVLLGPLRTMIEAKVPVIAVSAVRTGCGKSQVGRWLSAYLRSKGLSAAVIRHPMPYGDLERQAVQRFASQADLAAAACTIEEREEYEPHVAAGHPIFAGVDYARIVKLAEAEGQLILWEGGNNDYPFLRPDLHIVLADALRPDQETSHHPGEAVLRMADVAVIAKSNSATREQVEQGSARAGGGGRPDDHPRWDGLWGRLRSGAQSGRRDRRSSFFRHAGNCGGLPMLSAHRAGAACGGLRRSAAAGARANNRPKQRRGGRRGDADRPWRPSEDR